MKLLTVRVLAVIFLSLAVVGIYDARQGLATKNSATVEMRGGWGGGWSGGSIASRHSAVEQDLNRTTASPSDAAVVVDLQMSILYADFIRQTAANQKDRINKLTLTITAQKSVVEVALQGKEQETSIVSREWDEEKGDFYFQKLSRRTLRKSFSAKTLQKTLAGQTLPGAGYFKNALWAVSLTSESGELYFIQIVVDFNQNSEFQGKAFCREVAGKDRSFNLKVSGGV